MSKILWWVDMTGEVKSNLPKMTDETYHKKWHIDILNYCKPKLILPEKADLGTVVTIFDSLKFIYTDRWNPFKTEDEAFKILEKFCESLKDDMSYE